MKEKVKATRMKTTETTEAVSSHGVGKHVEGRRS
jgi:hypothetical protein